MSQYRHHLRLLLLVVLPACWTGALAAEPVSESVTIWSDGVRLAGDLWKPAGLAPDERRPGVLLVHGWGGEKDHLNQAYAPQLAALGYVVLAFDYRGWGASDGKLVRTGARPQGDMDEFVLRVVEIRTVVDPLDQLEDVRNAYYFLIGDANVDPQRLAVWGTSLGGGLALATAATLPGFEVLLIQVGSVNPRAGASGEVDPAIEQWRTARARGDVAPFPGPETTAEGLSGFPDWPEFVRYDPFATHAQLNAATLIIDAADEELFAIADNGAALYAAIKDRVPARYETFSGKHYDVYRGDGYALALELQTEWLNEHLPIQQP